MEEEEEVVVGGGRILVEEVEEGGGGGVGNMLVEEVEVVVGGWGGGKIFVVEEEEAKDVVRTLNPPSSTQEVERSILPLTFSLASLLPWASETVGFIFDAVNPLLVVVVVFGFTRTPEFRFKTTPLEEFSVGGREDEVGEQLVLWMAPVF